MHKSMQIAKTGSKKLSTRCADASCQTAFNADANKLVSTQAYDKARIAALPSTQVQYHWVTRMLLKTRMACS